MRLNGITGYASKCSKFDQVHKYTEPFCIVILIFMSIYFYISFFADRTPRLRDTSHIEQVGGVPLVVENDTNQQAVPCQLIGGGEHFDDIDRNERRRRQRQFNNILLPRERLLASVVDQDLRRPVPRGQNT